MVDTVLTEAEATLILKLNFEEKMTVEEIECVTPFDTTTLIFIIEETSSN
ncbi:hypothetical protein [Bacillus sp. SA1-12]|nr:hypothetical protein [Bacillus sp. SA1-12]